MTSTARIEPTTIGSTGTPDPDLVRIGGRRPALPLPAPAEAFARDRVSMTLGRIPTLTFLASAGGIATVRLGPEPIGRRFRLRDYEVLYIVRADFDDEKVQDAVKRVNTLIERSGGAPERTNLWGKRKLAYEVKHQKEGAFVLQDFQLEPDRVPELEAGLKITEEVLRHLIVRKPEKVVPTPVPPTPAEVVLAPVAAGSVEAEGESRRPDREHREES